MISIRMIIYAYLCVAGITSVSQGIPAQTEDLVDEYYTIILKQNTDTIPQDDKDAQDIMDNNRKEETIASILPYRDKTRRFAIQQQMLTKIQPRAGISSKSGSHTTHYWISEYYPPQRYLNSTSIFFDLCFGLLEDENIVLAQYLENFLGTEDETWITIDMVLTKDMKAMVKTYDRIHAWSYKFQRKSQKRPFVNMLRAWVRHNRDSIEASEPNHDDVVKDANALKAEHDSHHWHKKSRHQLELILMYKSIKYARAVLTEFEAIMGNKTESIINDCIQNDTKLNHDLADAYSSLAKYVKNKHNYIAEILYKYSNGSDYWAAWIMSIAVLRPNEWSKVDLAFQKNYGEEGSLTKFITKKLTTDEVMAEMIAVIIDPNFKPSKFSGNSVQGGQGGILPTPAPAPPPVPTTTPA